MSTSERIIRGLGVFSSVAFLVAALTPASNAVGRKLAIDESIKPAGAIVVLAAGVNGEFLEEESVRRIVRGIQLYKQGLAPLLVVTGPCSRECTATEAEVRYRLARSMGIAPETIIKEETATTTREESTHVVGLLQKRNVNRILLVTDATHMRRAKLVFERAGADVLPAVSSDYPAVIVSIPDRLWLTMRVVEEGTALIYYRIAGYI